MLDMAMIGQKFGTLTVIGFQKNQKGQNMYLCQCECGKQMLQNKTKLIQRIGKASRCMHVKVEEKYRYLIGQTIKKWTVLDVKKDSSRRDCYAVCQCICGNIKDVNIFNLIGGRTDDCGCGRKEKMSEMRSSDLVGQKFGKLTVLEKLSINNVGKLIYRCRCDCGNEITVVGSSLLSGHTHSCGCILSYPNMYINQLLTDKNIVHQPEYTVNIDNQYFRFDFYLPTYNAMIEYDGEQHYKPIMYGCYSEEEALAQLEKRQKFDEIKNKYCEDYNIPLLRIPYWERKHIDSIIDNYLQRLNERECTEAI